MSVNIEILQNGQLKKTMSLENGTYNIGRDPAADIVLDSKTVSKNHAALVISNDSFRVIDKDSSNGVYWQGGKISDKEFKNSFQIELSPFTIRTAVTEAPAPAGKAAFLSGSLGFLVNSNIKIAFSIIIVLGMLLSLLLVYIPLKSSAGSIQQREWLKKGILLSRYLGEMNRPFLQTADHTLVRTAPVDEEGGVLYAFVVDGRGRIIAPHEQQGNFFNWEGLSRTLRDARPRVEKGSRGEKLIFSPIAAQDKIILGGAIIGFAAENDESAPAAGIGGAAVFLLLLLFGLSATAAYLLAANFLNPLKLFHEEVEVAIKQGRDHIEFAPPYEELDNLKLIVNRLLLRKTSTADLASEPLKTGSPDKGWRRPENDPGRAQVKTGPAEKSQPPPPAADENLAGLTGPWCLVDLEGYTLTGFSDNFTRNLGLKECRKGMHIIEVFDSDLIVTVTQLIEDPGVKTLELEAGGKKYRVSRGPQSTDKTGILIVFEETGP